MITATRKLVDFDYTEDFHFTKIDLRMDMVRDSLAKQRTVMANSRTILAFVRTALMIFATGVTFIKIFHDDQFLVLIGWIFIPVSVVVLALGAFNYIRNKKKLMG